MFYLGEKQNSTSNSALYLADHSAEFSIAGTTALKGEILIPNGQVKYGVPNIGYTGNSQATMDVKNSTRQLPKHNNQRIKSLVKEFKKRTEYTSLPQLLEQSFLDPTVYISGNVLRLENVKLKGNIIVKARDSIVIGKNAIIEDVLFFAPTIKIEDGFNGQLQAFASEKMIVGENSVLEYPSVLAFLRDERLKENATFQIQSNAEVNGLVLVYEPKHFTKPTYLKVEPNALIKGQIFADAKVDFRGMIYGNLTCSGLWYESSMLKMKNFLLNATIDKGRLSTDFISPFIAQRKRKVGIAKWIEE